MGGWYIDGQQVEAGVTRMSAEDWVRGKGPRGGTYWQNTKTGDRKYQQENPGGKGGSKSSVKGAPSKSSSDFDSNMKTFKSGLDATREAMVPGYSRDTPAGKMTVKDAFGDDAGKVTMGRIGDLQYTMIRKKGLTGLAGSDISVLVVADDSGKTLFYHNQDMNESSTEFPRSGPEKSAVESLFGAVVTSDNTSDPKKSSGKIPASSTSKMPKSSNKEWGFYGTIRSNLGVGDSEADNLWDKVGSMMIDRYGLTPDQAKLFLDTSSGRHLADSMTGSGRKLKDSLPEWLDKTINRHFATKTPRVGAVHQTALAKQAYLGMPVRLIKAGSAYVLKSTSGVIARAKRPSDLKTWADEKKLKIKD